MTRMRVEIIQHKDSLYYVPIARAGGLGVLQYTDATNLPKSVSYEKKGRRLLETLEIAGKEVPRPSHLSDTFTQYIQPFLNFANVKSWKSFVDNAKSLDVELENSMLLFGPNEYERGGFSGLKDSKFEISAKSPLEDIGKAIERGLSLCIGKK